MAGSFGGSVKLTGESEYRKALNGIKDGLKVLSSEMKIVTAEYGKNDTSTENLTKQNDLLNKKIEEQKKAVSTLSTALQVAKDETGENSVTTKKWQTELNNAKAELVKMETTVKNNSEAIKNNSDVFKKYENEISKFDDDLKLLASEMKVVTSQYDTNDKSLKNLTAQSSTMTKQVEAQKDKVATLTKALAQAEEETGKNSATTKKWQTELNNATAELNKTEKELNKTEKELKELEKQTTGIGKLKTAFSDWKGNMSDIKDKLSPITNGLKNVASAAANVAKTSFKAFSVGVAAVSAGLVKIGKDAIEAYADTEQLRGGVETLFKNASDEVIKNANDAFKTAGMSANEYMETVTSFSASLIQSVGGDTAKAAKLADQAIVDMSDNANKMGTDISSIQNAYQGFAKQNYTMLDNLKLGYGGTKEEMQRLLADAEKLTGKKFDISNFADITEAIHAIQTQYGITGTTAKEASSTIQGSISSMKSAWQNLLAGLADDNANLDQLFKNLVDSIFTVADNVVPRIKTVLANLSKSITEYAPTIINELVSGLVENLSPLVESAVTILSSLVTALTDEKNLKLIIQAAVDLVLQLVDGLIDNLEPLIDGAFLIMTELASALLEPENLDKLIKASIRLVTTITTGLLEHIPELINAGLQIVGGLIKGIWDNRGQVVEAIKDVGRAIMQGFKNLLGINSPSTVFSGFGTFLVEGLWQGMSNSLTWIRNKIRGWVGNVTDFIKRLFGINSPSRLFRDEIGKNLALGLGEGFTDNMEEVKRDMADAIPKNFNSDLKLDVNSIASVTSSAAQGTSKMFNFNLEFNINGNFDKTNINQLADIVSDKIYRTTKQRMEAFA